MPGEIVETGPEKSSGMEHGGPESGGASGTGFAAERAELAWVLQHPELSRSANLVRFLSFICAKYFEGESREIREYSIAVEALGRKPASFDSNVDPIVRVTARALRKKLGEIYAADGSGRPLRIALPLGHYVPQFLPRGQELAEHAAEVVEVAEVQAAVPDRAGWLGRVRWQWVVAGVAVPLVFVAGYLAGRTRERPVTTVTHGLEWGAPVWSDEFDGPTRQTPDATRWTYDLGNEQGWGNQEQEVYCAPQGGGAPGCDVSRPNAFLDGSGHLVIRAERGQGGVWRSARLTTRGLKNFQYGRIEARMKLPVGAGLWPSFWMLGSDFGTAGWPAAGSVTLAENVDYTARTNGLGPSMIRSVVHGPHYYGGNGLWRDYKLPNGARVDDGSFHTYGIIWSPGMVQFYVDDPANVFFTQDASDIPEGGEWVFDHPFYLMLNLAVGGDWPGSPGATTPNPADLLVDYVRAYAIPPVAAPSIEWQPVPVKAGSSVASIVTLHAQGFSGRVHLTCQMEPATASCGLATSVVNFSDTLSQEDTLTIGTDSYGEHGRLVAPPGRYKVTITATTISGDHSQLTVPFEVKAGE